MNEPRRQKPRAPAKAGAHHRAAENGTNRRWVPAFAGTHVPITSPKVAMRPAYAGMPLIDFTSMKSLRPNSPPSRPLPDAL